MNIEAEQKTIYKNFEEFDDVSKRLGGNPSSHKKYFEGGYFCALNNNNNFQDRVNNWMQVCFTPEICKDTVERNHRFLEESLELVQSLGCTKREAYQLVEYVFGRPEGEPYQEVGGVMVTLAALCTASGTKMVEDGERELKRISNPDITEKIREKQKSRSKYSPLPVDIIELISSEAGIWCINNCTNGSIFLQKEEDK